MSNKSFDKYGEGDVGIVLASVDIVMFSLDPDRLFVEGYILTNRFFWACRLLFFFNTRVFGCE